MVSFSNDFDHFRSLAGRGAENGSESLVSIPISTFSAPGQPGRRKWLKMVSSPYLCLGFLFLLLSASRSSSSPSSSRPLSAHTHTHTHTHTHIHTHTHSLTLTHSHPVSLTLSLTHSLSFTHSLTLCCIEFLELSHFSSPY